METVSVRRAARFAASVEVRPGGCENRGPPQSGRPFMIPNQERREPPRHSQSPTLFFPRLRTPQAIDSRAWSLSPELRGQITGRLRLIAITYALAFFFADIVPA